MLIALVDETKPLTTKYGTVAALSKLGPEVVRVCLLPNAKTFAANVFEATSKKPSDAKSQHEPMDVDQMDILTEAGAENVSPEVSSSKQNGNKASYIEVQHLLDVYAEAIATIVRLDEESERRIKPEGVMEEEASAREDKIMADFGNVLGAAVIKCLKS